MALLKIKSWNGIRPPLDKIVVLPNLIVEEKTASGLIIPETAQEKEFYGTVVAVGLLCKFTKVGDTVAYGASNGQSKELIVAGEKVKVLVMYEVEYQMGINPEELDDSE